MRKICVLGLVLFLGACGTPEKQCSNDASCGQGQICEKGTCVAGCRETSQCKEGEYCREGQCTPQVCTPGSTQKCYEGDKGTLGVGPCKEGEQLCLQEGRGWSACFLQEVPGAEICDGVDNDCDGKTDEGLKCDCQSGSYRRCYTGPSGTLGVGLCRQGIQYCTSKDVWGPCLNQMRPTPEQCDGLDNDCDGFVDEDISCDCTPGAQRKCYSGPKDTQGVGACKQGQQSCGTNGRWGRCLAQVLPRLEEDDLCNGRDDDCDGETDNIVGTTDDLRDRCYEAPSGTRDQGLCEPGIRTCQKGVWSPCVGQTLPTVEDCNGKDDDCDGKVDEGLSPRPCLSPSNAGCSEKDGVFRCKGKCDVGRQRCKDGDWDACTGDIKPAAQESCGDGIDDDCNGKIDDNCGCKEGQTQPCYTGPQDTQGRGSCAQGTRTCSSGRWGDCAGQTLPQKEICNGKDDDCDGQTDNLSGTCSINGKTGICAIGQLRCQQGKITCEPTPAAVSEICNGKDDDCDGQIDNISDRGKPCTDLRRQGICQAGYWDCKGGQKTCIELLKAIPETCSGKDDNCDGFVDNISGTCTVPGQVGVCATGRLGCDKGQQICQAQNTAGTETCNGLDDDCNGLVDDLKDLHQACQDPNRFGPCRPGKWACVKNQKTCEAQQQAKPELCNKIDDDCDGAVDEGLPGCKPCTTSRECPVGHLCLQGHCAVAECLSNGDCSGGKICKALKCVHCATSIDCPTQQFCDTSQSPAQCRSYQCQVNGDCGFGLRCDPSSRQCVGCKDSNQCPSQHVCESGLCYKICQLDSHCKSSEACTPLVRNGTSTKRCYPRCTTDAECPTGFGCLNSLCQVKVALDANAYQWGDGRVGASCTEYRHPPTGYIASLTSGPYWVQPDPKKPRLKVFCDMQMNEGGWMLLARYDSKLLLKDYNPTKHQLQDTTQGQTSTAAVELTDGSKYGHVAFNLFSLQNRELMIRCREAGTSTWKSTSRFSVFKDWSAGVKGTLHSANWGILVYPNSGGQVASRKDLGLCGEKDDNTSTALRGIAYCSGKASDASSHLASLAFDPTTGKLSVTCNKASLSQGEAEIWLRETGSNPLVMDSSGTRQWRDGTVAASCLEYKNSVGGQYTGATGSGSYWIQSISTQPRFKVYCNMDLDLGGKVGGFTLIARYTPNRSFVRFHPFRHQLQSGGGTDRTNSPDLSVSTTYGHINYKWFPLDSSKRLIFACRRGNSWTYVTRNPAPMTSWDTGRFPHPGGATTWLNIHPFTNGLPLGLANGGQAMYCNTGNYQTHRRKPGMMLCRKPPAPSIYHTGFLPHPSSSGSGMYIFCNYTAFHSGNPTKTPPGVEGYLYIR